MKITLSPFPILTTDRLVLRPLNISDREDLMHLRNNKQVNKYLDRNTCNSIDDAEEFIKKIHQSVKDRNSVYWVISLKEHTKLIGTICYYSIIVDKCIAEIGYELTPVQQGKGLMQEAIAKVIDYGFESMELKAIIAVSHPANESSVKLLKRNDFELDTRHEYVSPQEAGALEAYVLLGNTHNSTGNMQMTYPERS